MIHRLSLTFFVLVTFLTSGLKAQETTEKPKVIHVLVALCDNKYQGIVPVSASLGNGDDPAKNLYWGAAFGIKTFFKKSNDWKLVQEFKNPVPPILERIIYQYKNQEIYLVADAYQGREIGQTTIDFLQFASGNEERIISFQTPFNKKEIKAGASANLLIYVGHDGLMDFSLSDYPQMADTKNREVIIFACISKTYFAKAIKASGAFPLIWTTNLMAPEAYIVKAAAEGWVLGEKGEILRNRVAKAYHSYQKCGLKAALALFVSGW